MVFEAHLVSVLVVVRIVAVRMSVRHVFVVVTGMWVRMAGLVMLVLMMVRCIVLMFFGHRVNPISLSLCLSVSLTVVAGVAVAVGPSVAM